MCGFIDTFEHIWDHLNLCPSAMSNQLLSFSPGLYLPQVKDMGILLDSCLIVLTKMVIPYGEETSQSSLWELSIS